MRYLKRGTTTAISRIGLGTWQFGSREWGYGQRLRRTGGARHRAPGGGAGRHPVRHRGDLRLRPQRADPRRRAERSLGEDRDSVFLATKIFPLFPVAPVVEQRAVASANRLGVRRLDLYQVHQPNPLVRDGTIMRGMRALQRSGWSAR